MVLLLCCCFFCCCVSIQCLRVAILFCCWFAVLLYSLVPVLIHRFFCSCVKSYVSLWCHVALLRYWCVLHHCRDGFISNIDCVWPCHYNLLSFLICPLNCIGFEFFVRCLSIWVLWSAMWGYYLIVFDCRSSMLFYITTPSLVSLFSSSSSLCWPSSPILFNLLQACTRIFKHNSGGFCKVLERFERFPQRFGKV